LLNSNGVKLYGGAIAEKSLLPFSHLAKIPLWQKIVRKMTSPLLPKNIERWFPWAKPVNLHGITDQLERFCATIRTDSTYEPIFHDGIRSCLLAETAMRSLESNCREPVATL
jgi:hypothetical protein